MEKKEFEELKERAIDITPEEFNDLRSSLTPEQQAELTLAFIQAHSAVAYEQAAQDMRRNKNTEKCGFGKQ